MSHTRDAIANQMRYRFDQVRMVLEGPRKRYGPGQEIVRRPKKKMSTPDASTFVMCQVQGCSRIAYLQSKCPDCNIYRCAHPDHYSHASHSELEIAVVGSSEPAVQPASALPIASSGRGNRGRGRGSRGRGSNVATSIVSSTDTVANLQEQVLRLTSIVESMRENMHVDLKK